MVIVRILIALGNELPEWIDGLFCRDAPTGNAPRTLEIVVRILIVPGNGQKTQYCSRL